MKKQNEKFGSSRLFRTVIYLILWQSLISSRHIQSHYKVNPTLVENKNEGVGGDL